MGNNKNKKSFEEVQRAFEERGYKLLSTEYINAFSPLFYICLKHPNKIREINWNRFQRGSGCREFGYEKVSNILHKKKKILYRLARKKFDEKGLYLLTSELDYMKESNPIMKFVCCCSPEIIQTKTWHSFLLTPHCNLCVQKKKKEETRKAGYDKLINLCNEIGYQLISPYEDYVNACGKIICRCPKHGNFTTKLGALVEGKRCPVCNETKGERNIRGFLEKYSVFFEAQKRFPDLKTGNKRLMSYDFYLPKYNLLIEYQGEFHDGTVNKINPNFQTTENLRKQQQRDETKRKYAQTHNIKLLEIWYWDYDNIEKILAKELNIV